MSKGTWIVVCILVVLILVFGALYLFTRPMQGNDKAGIEKAISKNGGTGEMISVIDMTDAGGSRYAAFMEGENTLGIAVFFSDGSGNFVYENIYRKQGEAITLFYDPFNVDIDGTHGVDIVVSKNPLLAKVVRYVDDKIENEVPVNTGGASMVVMEFHSAEVALNVRIECLDVQGNVLNP